MLSKESPTPHSLISYNQQQQCDGGEKSWGGSIISTTYLRFLDNWPPRNYLRTGAEPSLTVLG
jgi:hypothetical protein